MPSKAIVVETSIKGRKAVQSKGTVDQVKGKNARLNLSMAAKDAALATIETVYTIGPENPTNAELAQTKAVLGVLQETTGFLSHPLARRIYLGDVDITIEAFP
jgi:primosomal protein N'